MIPTLHQIDSARKAALEAIASHRPEPTAVMEFSSAGRLLLIVDADETAALSALRESSAEKMLWVADDSIDSPTQKNIGGIAVVNAAADSFCGHLGGFEFFLRDLDKPTPLFFAAGDSRFDVVIDACEIPVARRLNPLRTLPPPGYIVVGPKNIADGIAQAEGLCGVFQKPKYFEYNASICAHSSSGIIGCNKCIDNCPARAIESRGEKIEVDANLCQGCGACASGCPTGAIRYAYPRPRDTLSAIKSALGCYRESLGESFAQAPPLALFYRADDASFLRARKLSPQTLPFAIEEIASIGIEVWTATLAFGAGGVAVLAGEKSESSARLAVESEIKFAREILAGIGYPQSAISLLNSDDEIFSPSSPLCSAATFAPNNDKRQMFFAALDHLAKHSPKPPMEFFALSNGASFGEVIIDSEKCTLCMSCVGACPSSALRDGGDSPRLRFIEENCVQCGLCESVCPEDAVSLSPRILYDRESRRQIRTLYEEQPFCCIACGKAFAAAKMLARIEKKLEGHWMFQDDAARRRLRMCEDCRVAAMLADGGGKNAKRK